LMRQSHARARPISRRTRARPCDYVENDTVASGTARDHQRNRREAVNAEDARCLRAEIDHSSAHERPAIVDSHRRGEAIALVDDGNHTAERQRRVGGGHGIRDHLLAARGEAAAIDRSQSRSLEPMCVTRIPRCRPDPGTANIAVAAFGMVADGRGAGTRLAPQLNAGCGWMRSREQGADFEACRDNAGERPGDGGNPDGTTLRRVLISQYGFLSCLVTLAVDQPPTPISEEIKGVTLDLTPAWQCRMTPSQSKGTRFCLRL